jgi:hypothetical protein
MATITIDTDILESLIALSGTGLYGTAAQRMHLADAREALEREAIAVASQGMTGHEQLALFDASKYDA